jgi:hypothetical protein
LPADFRIKGDHPTVRKMVGRGRRILKAVLGEEGWKEQARGMKAEAKRWRSKSDTQRRAELEAEASASRTRRSCGAWRKGRGRANMGYARGSLLATPSLARAVSRVDHAGPARRIPCLPGEGLVRSRTSTLSSPANLSLTAILRSGTSALRSSRKSQASGRSSPPLSTAARPRGSPMPTASPPLEDPLPC